MGFGVAAKTFGAGDRLRLPAVACQWTERAVFRVLLVREAGVSPALSNLSIEIVPTSLK